MTEAFRIGCCYRQRDGRVRKLVPIHGVTEWRGRPAAEAVEPEDMTARIHGYRYLDDGGYVYNCRDLDLLPGEVTESGEPVNPAFVPFRVRCVDDSMCLGGLHQGHEYLVTKVVTGAAARSGDYQLAGVPLFWFAYRFVRVDDAPTPTPTLDALANTTERIRPPLDWAKPAVFDPFPGFVVKSDEWDSEFNGEHFGTLGGVSLDTPQSLRVKEGGVR